MSIQIPESNTFQRAISDKELDKQRRRRLSWLIALLLILLISTSMLFVRYLLRPAPLPELLPLPMDWNIRPHYLFSIYGVNKPLGVALSPEGDRIYVTESDGERLIRVFDRDGDPLGSFAPPRTRPGERAPVYLATDSTGRIFVTDRLQHAVFVYNREGVYLDTILGPDLTLSEYLSKHLDHPQTGTTFAYNAFETYVHLRRSAEGDMSIPAPEAVDWSPLGIFIDETGRMFLTDVAGDHHTVHDIAGSAIFSTVWQDFDPPKRTFGSYGQGNGQFLFPNAIVIDEQGRIYITDGNNGRVSVWDKEGRFLFNIGQGSGDDALSLPRGAAIDDGREYLYVVDAVQQCVKVFDVSEPKPNYVFSFGNWGLGDGQFNYPNDIAIDLSGRIYVVDRENNRIQVWLY